MKKPILFIAALYYFVVTCGVVINLHYCMDRLASTSFFGREVKKCGRCGMDIHASDGCCRDELQIVKLEEDQDRTAVLAFELPALDDQGFTPSAFIVAAFYNFSGQRHFHNHSPPLLSASDTYLENNVFRI